MNQLIVNFENCYGIKKLDFTFDLAINEKSNGVYAIYAPNGFMKTSFSRTFLDIAEGTESEDLIFPERQTVRQATIDGNDILPNQIMVVKPYDESYSSQNISTLLVNENLKKKYETALKDIDKEKSSLIKELKNISGISGRKISIETALSSDFSKSDKDFLDLLVALRTSTSGDFSSFYDIVYSEVFNEQTLKLITSGAFTNELNEYISTYEELIEQSPILSKQFNHQNAGLVSKNLGETGFFTATHTVNLSINGAKTEVSSQKALQDLLQQEQDKILSDPSLVKKFQAFDKKLGNAETKRFRDYLTDHKELLPELVDFNELQRKLWIAYLQKNDSLWKSCVEIYETNKERIQQIIEQAKQERTVWESVVNLFNKRFDVPFNLSVANQDDVILQNNSPSIKFDFADTGEIKSVNRDTLLKVLSQGERRALYILNILFEIEIRNKSGTEQLIIIDDIADSFDYKNKYAIIEYLRDLAQNAKFRLIILSHNFDFYRTISGRLNIGRPKKQFVTRDEFGVTLQQEHYQKDVFDHWKKNLHQNQKFSLASIAFARNVAEYSGHTDEYRQLTSLLHIKSDTEGLTFNSLNNIYKNIFKDFKHDLQNLHMSVVEAIYSDADQIVTDSSTHIELEDKVILAISIRLLAEKFMMAKINDVDWFNSITKDQTRILFDRFLNDFSGLIDEISILDKVNLMTPENIHLNSFMYEPILDMSSQHLYCLHGEVKNLLEKLS